MQLERAFADHINQDTSYHPRDDTEPALSLLRGAGYRTFGVLVMAKKEAFTTGSSDAFIRHDGQRNQAGASSRPTPEDGLRLIHAFTEIKQAALREAIIQLAEELSKLRQDKQ